MARVIRGAEVRSASVLEALDEAGQILEKAHHQGADVVAAQRAALRQQAESRARTELAAAQVALEARYESELETLRGQVTTLAIAVAERVLGSEVETRPELIRKWVEDATSRVARARVVRVRVHPEDVGHLELGDGVVEADPSLERGDCVVESELGVVDARLAVKLEALRDALDAGST